MLAILAELRVDRGLLLALARLPLTAISLGRAHGRECGAGSSACAAHVGGMFTDLERPQAAFEAVGLSSGKKLPSLI